MEELLLDEILLKIELILDGFIDLLIDGEARMLLLIDDEKLLDNLGETVIVGVFTDKADVKPVLPIIVDGV